MNWFGSVGAQLTAAESADLQSVLEELDVSVGNSHGISTQNGTVRRCS